ncbi:MAG: hypothetical protein J7M27_09310 [Candidatus Latescibacteria bacterium]|nr:hypothetical protein [Candidatus Latescibacterota bacterium]
MKRIALINGRVFDGSGRPVPEPATVLIEGSAIATVWPASGGHLPP